MKHGIDACLIGVINVKSYSFSIMVGVVKSKPSLKTVEIAVLSISSGLFNLAGS